MSYIGGGMYHAEYCPRCGCLMWNGRCENHECEFHWHPMEEDEPVKLENAVGYELYGTKIKKEI